MLSSNREQYHSSTPQAVKINLSAKRVAKRRLLRGFCKTCDDSHGAGIGQTVGVDRFLELVVRSPSSWILAAGFSVVLVVVAERPDNLGKPVVVVDEDLESRIPKYP